MLASPEHVLSYLVSCLCAFAPKIVGPTVSANETVVGHASMSWCLDVSSRCETLPGAGWVDHPALPCSSSPRGKKAPHKICRIATRRSEFRNYACAHRVPHSLAAEKELEERRQMESGELLACHVRHKDVSIASCRAIHALHRTIPQNKPKDALTRESIDRSIDRTM